MTFRTWASEYLWGAIRYSIRVFPSVPFTEGIVLGEIPGAEEDIIVGREDLRESCETGTHEKLESGQVGELVRENSINSVCYMAGRG